MTVELSVTDITSYLAASGWVRQPGEWRGAASWVHEGDHEVLVPARDGMGDGERRIREILVLLAVVEGRSREAIATDIGSPMADVQWYRAVPDDAAGGSVSLVAALSALEGARDVLGAAARAVLAGPHVAFDGAIPREVRDLLARVRLAPFGSADDVLTIRFPLADAVPADLADRVNPGMSEPVEDPLARRVLLLLQDAVLHLRDAAGSVEGAGDLGVFDEIVTAGVSANLCAALARFAGPGPGQPFEVGFRWARALPAESPPRTVTFERGTGALLRRAARRLRRLQLAGPASVTGLIGTLYDDGSEDRFRVQVRGDVAMERGTGTRRTLWVRLPDSTSYDRAIAAHRDGRQVLARGALTTVNGRLELATGPGDFQQLA